ncbi:MAG: hypothetical protein ACLQOO_36535 [Terriglobia bacterium]
MARAGPAHVRAWHPNRPTLSERVGYSDRDDGGNLAPLICGQDEEPARTSALN